MGWKQAFSSAQLQRKMWPQKAQEAHERRPWDFLYFLWRWSFLRFPESFWQFFYLPKSDERSRPRLHMHYTGQTLSPESLSESCLQAPDASERGANIRDWSLFSRKLKQWHKRFKLSSQARKEYLGTLQDFLSSLILAPGPNCLEGNPARDLIYCHPPADLIHVINLHWKLNEI